jgi:hypothetical protein
MRLFAELTEEVHFLTEEDDKGNKEYFIEGIFMQGGIKNRNGRMYPVEVLAKECARYTKEYIEKNRAYGELGHPAGPTINLERVSHMTKSLEQDGKNFVGKAKIMDTPMGNIVKNLMVEGATLGVSSRGMGTLKPKSGYQEVQSDFQLATAADIVADPSAPEAFVEGIMEGVEWILENGKWTARNIEHAQDIIRSASSPDVEKAKLAVFNSFMKSL